MWRKQVYIQDKNESRIAEAKGAKCEEQEGDNIRRETVDCEVSP